MSPELLSSGPGSWLQTYQQSLNPEASSKHPPGSGPEPPALTVRTPQACPRLTPRGPALSSHRLCGRPEGSVRAGLLTGVQALHAEMSLWPQSAPAEPQAPRASLRVREALQPPPAPVGWASPGQRPLNQGPSGVTRLPLRGLGLMTCSVEGKIRLPRYFSVFCFDKCFLNVPICLFGCLCCGAFQAPGSRTSPEAPDSHPHLCTDGHHGP